MLLSFYLVVSVVNESEKTFMKVTKEVYLDYKKKLYELDRSKNQKKIYVKHYPVLTKGKIIYVVFGLVKQNKIEDIIPTPFDEKGKILRY